MRPPLSFPACTCAKRPHLDQCAYWRALVTVPATPVAKVDEADAWRRKEVRT